MPKDKFTLPTAETIDRIYGVQHPDDGSRYLNGVRMGIVKEDSNIAEAYHNQKKRYANLLASEVTENVLAADVAVKPPSSRNDAEVYLDAVVRETKARTLNGFSRKGKFKAGAVSTTVDDMIEELDYEPDGKEHEIKSLLIVDETVADGKTAAAMLHHLRKHGVPKDIEITLVAWAKVKN